MKLTITNVDFNAVIICMALKYEGKEQPKHDRWINHPPDAKWYTNQDLAHALISLYGGYNGELFCEMRRVLKTIGWWNTNAMCND